MSLATSVRKLTAARARTLRPRRSRGVGGAGRAGGGTGRGAGGERRRRRSGKRRRGHRGDSTERKTAGANAGRCGAPEEDRGSAGFPRSAGLLTALLGLLFPGRPTVLAAGLLRGVLGLILLLLLGGLGFLLRSLGRSGGHRLALDQLENRHLGTVTLTGSQLDDPEIATRTIGETRRDVVEHLLDEIAAEHPAQHPAAVVQSAMLAASAHPFGGPTPPRR